MRFAPRHGWRQNAGDRRAHEADIAVALPLIKIAPHLVVDVVLGRPPRFWHVEPFGLRWRLPVVLVEIPAPPDGSSPFISKLCSRRLCR